MGRQKLGILVVMEVPVDWGGEINSGGRGRGVSLAISQVPISIGLVGAGEVADSETPLNNYCKHYWVSSFYVLVCVQTRRGQIFPLTLNRAAI